MEDLGNEVLKMLLDMDQSTLVKALGLNTTIEETVDLSIYISQDLVTDSYQTISPYKQ